MVHILFDFDGYALQPDEKEKLDSVFDYTIIKDREIILDIAGHTDAMGSEDYNLKFSLLRTQTISNYFLKKGIPDNRMLVKGYGANIS